MDCLQHKSNQGKVYHHKNQVGLGHGPVVIKVVVLSLGWTHSTTKYVKHRHEQNKSGSREVVRVTTTCDASFLCIKVLANNMDFDVAALVFFAFEVTLL